MGQEIVKFTKKSVKSQEKWSWYQYESLSLTVANKKCKKIGNHISLVFDI